MFLKIWGALNSDWIGLIFSGIKQSDLDCTVSLILQPIDLINGCKRALSIDLSEVEVTIPAGARYGQKLRLRNKGNECPYRVGKRGDLYLLISES